MLTLSALFSRLRRDPSDGVLLRQLHGLYEQPDSAIHRYFAHADPSCHAALTALFARRATSARWLRRLAAAQIRARYRLDEEPPVDAQLLAALAGDPLCLSILGESLNTDIAFERACTRLRRACLLGLPIEREAEPLLAALALQAWNNEYLWEETAEEMAAVTKESGVIDAAAKTGDLVLDDVSAAGGTACRGNARYLAPRCHPAGVALPLAAHPARPARGSGSACHSTQFRAHHRRHFAGSTGAP
jgi:hypothetical protein